MNLNPFTAIGKVVSPIFRFGKHIILFYDSAERCEKRIQDHIDKYEKHREAMEKEIKKLTFNYLDRFEKVNKNISELKDQINENKTEMIMAFSISNDEMIKRIASSNEAMIDRIYNMKK